MDYKKETNPKDPKKWDETPIALWKLEFHEEGMLQCPYNEVHKPNGDCENSEMIIK